MTTTTKSDFLRGAKAGAPFLLVIGPFALLFGVVGTEAGLNLAQVMGFTVLVIAGASQFTAVQLMADNAPTLIVLATALAVNLRMAMYSASIAPWIGAAPLRARLLAAYGLIDQSYAVSLAEYEGRPDMPVANRVAFLIGSFMSLAPVWYLMTLVGALVGTRIPPEFALDFAVPITFLALIAPALRTFAHVVAALVSVALALLFAGFPYGTGLLLAAVMAMCAGAATEIMLEKRS